MMHKINVVLASIFTAVVMAVFPPVNCFLYRHLYLILPVMAGLWLFSYPEKFGRSEVNGRISH